jgi:glycosyltransferase involved in cell wall biosynthesis
MLVSGNVRPVPGDVPVGGAARQAVKLSQVLRSRGVETYILTHRPRPRFPSHEVVDEVPVRYVDSLYWLLHRKGLRRLEAILRLGVLVAYLVRQRRAYDIIHIHTGATVTALAGVLAGRWLGKPTVLKITNSGALNDFHRFREGCGLPAPNRLAALLRSATRVVTLNVEAAHELAAEGFDPQQIVHIPNGVEVNRILPKSCYKGDAPPHLTYIGRLHVSKGLDVLLETLAQLPSGLDWRLTLVGDGPARAALTRQAKRLGLEDRVVFTGEVSDVRPYLQAADIFVLLSSAEGISNALLEAMAAGLVCVAADNAGNRRVLTHNQTGMLVPLGDTGVLTRVLASVLVDPRLRERLGQAARRFVEANFSLSRVTEAYLALYQRLMGNLAPEQDGQPLYSYPLLQDAPISYRELP